MTHDLWRLRLRCPQTAALKRLASQLFTRFTVSSWCSFLIINTWRSWSKDTPKSVVTPGTHPLLSHPFFHLSWGQNWEARPNAVERWFENPQWCPVARPRHLKQRVCDLSNKNHGMIQYKKIPIAFYGDMMGSNRIYGDISDIWVCLTVGYGITLAGTISG